MAGANYMHCDGCGGKAFYDANIDWECQMTGDLAVLCLQCAKTHEVKVVKRETPLEAAHVLNCDARQGDYPCTGDYCTKPEPKP